MNYNFWQILIIILIGLLFAKDYLPSLLKRFFGIELKNGNGKNENMASLKAQIATLQDNHLRSLEEKIDKLSERMIEHNAEVIVLLKDIKELLKT